MAFVVHDHDGAGSFLARARMFLLADEDRNNLVLSLSAARVNAPAPAPAAGAGERPPSTEDEPVFATVEDGETGRLVGCVLRTPPHKVLLTSMPTAAARPVAHFLAGRYRSIPAVLGPVDEARAVAEAWTDLRAGAVRPGMEQGIYRLDRVDRPAGVPGFMRLSTVAEIDLAVRWGEGFSRDTGIPFPPDASSVARWLDDGGLHVWEDEGRATSIAVARGRTRRGVRIGYVYTPPELRGRGYATALVADLSQKMLDEGCGFCVLYTDLSNPTSNAIYRRIGYRLVETVQDFELLPNLGT